MSFTEFRSSLPGNKFPKDLIQRSIQLVLISLAFMHENWVVHTGKFKTYSEKSRAWKAYKISDISSNNVLQGIMDSKILAQIEDEEMMRPIPRKVYGWRWIGWLRLLLTNFLTTVGNLHGMVSSRIVALGLTSCKSSRRVRGLLRTTTCSREYVYGDMQVRHKPPSSLRQWLTSLLMLYHIGPSSACLLISSCEKLTGHTVSSVGFPGKNGHVLHILIGAPRRDMGFPAPVDQTNPRGVDAWTQADLRGRSDASYSDLH